MEQPEGQKLKCPRCGYSWITKSKLFMVSCPSCGQKVKRAEIKTKK